MEAEIDQAAPAAGAGGGGCHGWIGGDAGDLKAGQEPSAAGKPTQMARLAHDVTAILMPHFAEKIAGYRFIEGKAGRQLDQKWSPFRAELGRLVQETGESIFAVD